MPIYASGPDFDVVRTAFEEACNGEIEAVSTLNTALLNSSQDKALLLKLTERMEAATSQKMNLYSQMQKFAIDQ